jgi:single-strand DNA-binding protein
MAVRSLNKVMLIGNLTRDPNLRYTPSKTAVCSFGIATNRSWTTDDGQTEERTDFHNLVAWAKLAEICDQILQKGDKVYVEGRLQTREWKTDDGPDRRVTEVVIDNMIKLASPHGWNNDDDSSEEAKKESSAQEESAEPSEDESVDTEEVADDIPF